MTRLEGLGSRVSSGAVLGAVLLAPLLAYLWPLGFAAIVALAGVVAVLGRLVPGARVEGPLAKPRLPGLRMSMFAPLAMLLLIVLFAVVSVNWSPAYEQFGPMATYQEAESQTWLKLPMQLGLYAAVVLATVRLGPLAARRGADWLVWGAAALSVLCLFEGLSGALLYQGLREMIGDPIRPDLAVKNVAQATYVLALMAWPAMAVLRDRERDRIALLVAAAALISPLLLKTWAPAAAFVAAGAAALIVRRAPIMGPRIVAGAAAGFMLLAPWLILMARPLLESVKANLGASWAARIDIYAFTAERIGERPLQGWGLDASRLFDPPVPLHPHDAALQVWLELGLAGSVLAAAFWALVFAGRSGKPGGASAVAAGSAYFIIGALSFGVWQEWWLALGALTAVWGGLAAREAAEDPDAMLIEA
ncbi:O-antigen ligase family protein [Brevundimonas sp. 2R-24]|uniref:O-antigen ligase family protein n=1 Tax=Peiella sedimenti TaxID=3061083 RepID=A0ABT8SIT4_9CAUL|nr:O-antigen ligase family protein [Caulobacteraceae bacterium XZ-24]